MTKNERSVEDLIAELEGSAPCSGGPSQGKPPGGKARLPAAAAPGFGGRWLLAVALLAVGRCASGRWVRSRLDRGGSAVTGTRCCCNDSRQGDPHGAAGGRLAGIGFGGVQPPLPGQLPPILALWRRG